MGCDGRGTGAGAAGKRQAHPPFPDTQTQRVGPDDLRNSDIRLLREDRIMFEVWSKGFDCDGFNLVNKEDRVRIAHIDRDGVGEIPHATMGHARYRILA